MNKLDYITIDFETANTYKYSAISVGLVRFIDGKETESLSRLIKPPVMYFIPEWTNEIHHLTADDVKDSPLFPEVWNNDVMPFINKTPGIPLAAHNGNYFDMNIIRGCCDYYNMKYPYVEYIDTLLIAKATWPDFPSHKLTELGKHFGITYLAHDALEDSRTCGIVVELAAKKWGVNSVKDLLKACKLEKGFFYKKEEQGLFDF
ncbi:MAG: hypothetical protein K6C97_05890 [Treponema sp.]|nr:hypothetical protein [Treponema sp.]